MADTDKKFLDEDGVSQFAEETKKYVDKHADNADIHVTADDKANWNGKQDALSSQQIDNINDVVNKANDADVVHKSGNETVGGVKTFTSNIVIDGSGNQYQSYASDYVKGIVPSSIIYQGVRFYDDQKVSTVANHITGAFEIQYNTDGYNKAYVGCRNYAGTTQHNYNVGLRVPNDLTRSIDFYPSADNKINLGASSYKWADVQTYLLNGKTPAYADDLANKADKSELSDYYPISGGALTGNIIERNTDSDHLGISGSYWGHGAYLWLSGQNSGYAGSWYLSARDTEKSCDLVGSPSGVLSWGGKLVLTEDDLENYATKTELNAKQDALSNQQIQNIDDVANKANDADVVHKSGDETIGGVKTFSDTIKPKILFVNTDANNNGFQCYGGSMGVITEYGAGVTPSSTIKPYSFYVGKGRNYANAPIVIDTFMGADGNTTLSLRSASNSTTVVDNRLNVGTSFVDGDNPSYLPYVQFQNTKEIRSNIDNRTLLGTTTQRWADVNTVKINGINPGALSLPNHNSYLDIKSNLPVSVSDDLWATRYQITPTQDGILILQFNNCSGIVVWTNQNLPSYGERGTSVCIEKRVQAFVLKGVTYNIVTSNYSQVVIARLFYCQGNV